MCRVNFVDEHNLFMRYARNNQLTAKERLFWIALFSIANDRAVYNANTRTFEWPDGFFPVTNGELSLHSTLDKRSIEAVRNQLRQRGLIEFKSGNRNSRPPEYKINYLSIDVGYKIVPNDVPNSVPKDVPNSVPKDVPNSVPKDVPIYIDINKDKDIEVEIDKKNNTAVADQTAGEGERALDGFFWRNGQDMSQHIGVSEEMMAEARRITQKLFEVYGGRQPSEADVKYLMLETKTFDPAQMQSRIDPKRVQMVAYCFEQAYLNNCPGNWRYIQACLRKLDMRGIETLNDIDDFEEARKGGGL